MNFYLFIPNPFRKETFVHWWSYNINISENKAIELELFYDDESLIMIDFLISHALERDHHGVEFTTTLLGATFRFSFYDKRHREHFLNITNSGNDYETD